jgi:hypothetical protein
MGAPVVTGLDIFYPTRDTWLLPGETAEVHAQVLDPGAATVTIAVEVTDADGHITAEGRATVPLDEHLVLGAVLRQMDYDAGWSIAPVPGHPARWYVTAPG